MPNINFGSDKSEPKQAIVVSFDLSGFSDFCNRADAHIVLPKFLSRLFAELNGFLMEGWRAGLENLGEFLGLAGERRKVVKPEYIKFTGDGALMIWFTGWDGKFSDAFCSALVIAMRNLQQRIAAAVPEWEKEWRIVGLPNQARFGIAVGQVYGLRDAGSIYNEPVDYVGYSINLAVRLQNHCPQVGFLVHKTLHPSAPGIIALEAIGMKGARSEPVFAFASDLEGLLDGYFKTKFRRI